MASLRAEMRLGPEPIVLAPAGTGSHAARPPVRIFLGTEPAQHRAERVFVWSILRHRDPARRYEIHRMQRLAGFDRAGWTTGFTNYRFAIPHFAGARGRAIYNDVDQIYLADPGELFDLPLDDHGFLAVSPEDPSVMLIDCARMARVWSLEAAQRKPKSELLEAATRVPGLHGALAHEWNARDDEYETGRSKLLHYTTLHTQPWRPFPDRFVYRDNANGELWHELERSADAAGFHVFTREHPSEEFHHWTHAHGPEPQRGSDLDAAPTEDVPWMLEELLQRSEGALELRFDAERADPERGPDWWAERLAAASARHPDVRWHVAFYSGDEPVALREGGRWPADSQPYVWVLVDDRPGNSTQSLGLADELGWPYETKTLECGSWSRLHNRILGASRRGIDRARSSPLEPPWPDLVIAAGRRTAPVSLWVRKQSLGRTRLVHLGRKGGDDVDLFDLVVTPAYCRLFPHPRRIETSTALHRLSHARLAEAAAQWKQRLEAAPAPRIVLLVGGTSGQYVFDAATARRLGESVMEMARKVGGSVFATTSRRVTRQAGDALCEALRGAALVHRWSPDATENPYLGFLALADAIVVTGDSESMLAEATTVGCPVYIYPLPVRRSFRALSLPRNWTLAHALESPPSRRGTARPQRGLEYWCARAIERGFVRPARDLAMLHERLVQLGAARHFDGTCVLDGVHPLHEGREVVERVRALMGVRGD